MRIRTPFACAFLLLLLIAAYLGLSTIQISLINDKILHFLTFLILTICFYWVVEASRRRALNFTLVVCTLFLGVGSEILQGFLPNGRNFDLYDIIANIVGSLGGLAVCSWYHKGMLERKRRSKHYQVVPGEDGGEGGEGTADLELGERAGGLEPQESGITDAAAITGVGRSTPSLEEEVDNWDENAEDNWDDEEPAAEGGIVESLKASNGPGPAIDTEGKKRSD
ncbi:MAG: hypothetical protein M1819_006082 [Sarea resinae]|nr:MAG: hypothetical protein M1819_006082 [Sarea resinae]